MAPLFALMKTNVILELIRAILLLNAGILPAVISVTVVLMLIKIAHQVKMCNTSHRDTSANCTNRIVQTNLPNITKTYILGPQ